MLVTAGIMSFITLIIVSHMYEGFKEVKARTKTYLSKMRRRNRALNKAEAYNKANKELKLAKDVIKRSKQNKCGKCQCPATIA